jgi:hypothetical protein
VSDLFFSPVNIAALQQGIRYKVYVNSSGVHNIPNQSEGELLAMRSLYLDYSKNLPFDYIGQVKSLNIRVLDFAVPQIISEADMRLHTYGHQLSSTCHGTRNGHSVAGSKTERLAFGTL